MVDNKRIKKAVNWLISQGYVKNQKTLGEKFGITNKSYLSQLVNSNPPNEEFINKLCVFNTELNRDWLLTGQGNMLNSPDKSNAHILGGVFPASSHDNELVALVDYIPISAHATFIETAETSSSEFSKTGVILTPAEKENADEFKLMEVDGESMEPTILDGAKILIQQIPQARWHNASGVVVVVYGEYVVIKRIKANRLVNDNFIILESDNPDYGQMTVQGADIRAIFRAVRIVSSPIH